MITEDQTEVIAFLDSPSTHDGGPVERIETHASIVFLAGTRALKLKRAVRYDYLDFSTAARRREMCEAEVRVNRRTAPQLYVGAVPITRETNGRLAVNGSGRHVDWVVEMRRFDQAGLLDRLAAQGALPLDLMRPLARIVAELHRRAESCPGQGGRAGIAWVVDGNAADFAGEAGAPFDPSAAASLTHRTRAVLERNASLLDARRDAGLVRRCHGDLHLRNIVLLDGVPTLFDAVEFDDRIACIDVLYDLAFLVMDLWRRDLRAHANLVWNDYLVESAAFDGILLLPLFLSCRAAVRAKTSAAAAALQPDGTQRHQLEDLARRYLDMAASLLDPPGARLIAIGGYSGSGKSTLARRLAPLAGGVPGAVVIRSDELRKQMLGLDALSRAGEEAYAPEVTARVYAAAAERAASVLAGGQVVIVDAVFARTSDRQRVERVAALAGVPFTGMWLDAPEDVLIARVARRRDDASDADAAVVRAQLEQAPGELTWARIPAGGEPDDVVAAAQRYL